MKKRVTINRNAIPSPLLPDDPTGTQFLSKRQSRWGHWGDRAAVAILAVVGSVVLWAIAELQVSAQASEVVTILGIVHDPAGKPVDDATVRMAQVGTRGDLVVKTSAEGLFALSAYRTATYVIFAEKSGKRSPVITITASSEADQTRIDLVLNDDGKDAEAGHTDAAGPKQNSAQAMEFADDPNFTVAGVVDWTAVGGHGSDATLRTTEALSRETVTLKPESDGHHASVTPNGATESSQAEEKLRAVLANEPKSFAANRQLAEFYLRAGRYRESIPLLEASHRIDPANRDNAYDLALAYKEDGDLSKAREQADRLLAQQANADTYRLAGEIDEKLGDPLTAVHEFESAARLDPSERNYFEWGSELLFHRAVWQSKDVFEKGAAAYPKSARMLAALGTALFAGARYDEAAERLCAASDLDPKNVQPYIFMGKVEMAAPSSLECVEQRLKRFATEQPTNSLADYFYGMAILKAQEQSPNPSALQQAEALFTQAVNADSKCSDGYLQLGILSSSHHDYAKAMNFYISAIAANPQSGDAHYRLAVTYDRMGESDKAKREFQLHDEIEKQQAEAVEQQRRDVKQFLVVLDGQPASPAAH